MVETLLAIWFFIGIVLDMVVGVNAESNLSEHFRAAAAGVHKRATYAVDGLPFSAGEPAKG
jgi:hypothetical protein